MKNKHVQIDFWGIGAQKSGTSWLYSNLKNLPNFELPPIKGLHYFDRSPSYPTPNTISETFFSKRILSPQYIKSQHIKKAINRILSSFVRRNFKDLRFYLKWYFSDYDDAWYLSLFKIYDKFKGEITPAYSILNEKDIERMYRLSPNAKLILMLRNPIERAWSNYRHSKKWIVNFSFENVKYSEIIDFIESEGQLLRSDYIRTMNTFSKIFPKDQILICFYDAIIDNPERLLSEIIKFICKDIDISTKHLNLGNIVNKSMEIDCPNQVKTYLETKYYDNIKQLAEEYGGYFNKWYKETYGETSTNENKLLLPTIYMQ